MTPIALSPADARYPARLRERMDDAAPAQLTALGRLDLLALPKTALFGSTRCPGDAILRAYDQAVRWRDEDRCVISSFHSPVEKECLRILLRGDARVILCPARGMLERLPAQWAISAAGGRMLILSGFAATERRVTADLAVRRNAFVAALANEVWFAHITPGGQMAKLASMDQRAGATT